MPVIGDVYANPGSGQYITCFLPDMSDIEWQTVVGTGAGTIDLSPTAFLVSDCEQVIMSKPRRCRCVRCAILISPPILM